VVLIRRLHIRQLAPALEVACDPPGIYEEQHPITYNYITQQEPSRVAATDGIDRTDTDDSICHHSADTGPLFLLVLKFATGLEDDT
jgi:hypothetical protein